MVLARQREEQRARGASCLKNQFPFFFYRYGRHEVWNMDTAHEVMGGNRSAIFWSAIPVEYLGFEGQIRGHGIVLVVLRRMF